MEHWTRGPTIGRGSTATVSLATDGISGNLFAVKSTELSRSSFLQKEQCFLSKLSCPHVVKYLGYDVSIEDNSSMYNLLMEYVSGGTLFDEIRRRGGQLEESMIQFYTHQIVRGLEYLHANSLVHCDIKSQNILVNEECAKIADLGCAKLVQRVAGNEDSATIISGTPVFMAPEVARGEEQGFEADIWALGCTVIEMATGGGPWPEIDDPVSALYQIGFSGDLPEFPTRLSNIAKDFLGKCLTRDPRQRWTAEQLLEHPFLEECYHLGSNNTEQVKEFNFTMRSPISVLDDQGLWDSFEVTESPKEQSVEGVCLNSPLERIKSLIGSGTSCTFSNVPNWDFDENWSTVRSNDADELVTDTNKVISVDELVAAASSNTASITHEELDSSISDEELGLEYSFDFFSSIGRDERSNFVMVHSVTEDSFVSINLESESDNKNFHFIHSHCYRSCFNLSGQVVLLEAKFLSSLFYFVFVFVPRATKSTFKIIEQGYMTDQTVITILIIYIIQG